MANITVKGVDGNAKVKNSSVSGIQGSVQGLPLPEGISKMEVTGVTGDAQVDNSSVAGINTGQMGSIGDRSINNQGNIGNIATGDNNSGSMSASVGGPTSGTKGLDIELMTVEDVQNLLTRERFSESVRKTFEENGIDGKYFVNLLEDGVLDELGVTSCVDKMKIKTILEKRSKESS